MSTNKAAASGTSSTTSKRIAGVVVSDKMQGTIIVEQTRLVKHPRYGKYVKRRTRVYADNPGDKARLHDSVVVESCRPLSKLKSWRLVSRKAAIEAEPIPDGLASTDIAAAEPASATPAAATPAAAAPAAAPAAAEPASPESKPAPAGKDD